MGSCRNSGSDEEPVCSSTELILNPVSGELTFKEASLTSPCSMEYSCCSANGSSHISQRANADQVSVCPDAEGSDIQRVHIVGDSRNIGTSSFMGENDEFLEAGISKCESCTEVDLCNVILRDSVAETVERPSHHEVGPGAQVDELVMTGASSSPNVSSLLSEQDDDKRKDALLLEGDNLEEAIDHVFVADTVTGPDTMQVPLEGDACCYEISTSRWSGMTSEEVIMTPGSFAMDKAIHSRSLKNDDTGVLYGKVDEIGHVEADAGNRLPGSPAGGMPQEISLPSSNDETVEENEANIENLSDQNIKASIDIGYAVDTCSVRLALNENARPLYNSYPADFPTSIIQALSQKDNTYSNCLSTDGASEDERRVNTLALDEQSMGIEAASLQGCEMPLEKKSADLLLASEKISVGTSGITNSAVEIKDLVSTGGGAGVETAALPTCEITTVESKEPDCVTDADQENDRKIYLHACSVSDKRSSDAYDIKVEDMFSQVLPFDFQGIFLSSHISHPSNGENGSIQSNRALVATDRAYVKQKSVVSPDELVQPNARLLPLEENSGSLKEGLCRIAAECTFDESFGPPDSCVGNYFSTSSSDLNLSKVNLAGVTTLTEAVNEVGEGNGERKDHASSFCVSQMKCPEVMPSSSSCRRDYQDGKSGRKIRVKKGAKNSGLRKMAYTPEALDLIFKGSKGKRTCSSKTPRSSAWGVLRDLPQHFEQKSQVSQKVNGRGCGNQRLKDPGGILQGSNGKTHGSSKRIRLKVKVGSQVVLISEVVDNVASTNTRGTASTMDVKDRKRLERLDKKLDKEKTYSLSVNLDTSLIPKDSAGGVDLCSEPPTHMYIESVGAVEDRFLGSETSPDSEVINLMPEAHVTERHTEGVDNIALNSFTQFSAHGNIDIIRKGNKKDKQSSKRRYSRKKVCEDVASLTGAIGMGNSGNTESLSLPREEDAMPTSNGEEFSHGLIDSEHPKNKKGQNPKNKKGQKLSKGSKSGRIMSDSRPEISNSSKKKEGSACRKSDKAGEVISKRKVKELAVHDQVLHESETCKQIGTSTREPEVSSKGHHGIGSAGNPHFEMIRDQLTEELLPSRNAWVRCDDCHKWRRISATLADNIEATNSSWTCKDNMDRSFADCSTPQEKSNADINAELEISDEDEDYDAHRNYKDMGFSHPPVSQQSSFIQIDSNKYLHRSRRTQTIDEVMVCHCMQPSSGKLGCGEECLNRMLNIECVQGTCPCGDLCSNMQFQKRNYAKLQWVRCGKKGYGLQLRENVRKGGFIIEYVGEVLDVPSYEARQRDYASKGHKHFYFMTLNGSEVIDACIKGNLGRFINHSCEPNCRTEKWMVNGEICIGLCAVMDIKKGEELTFDYNYVRVFGAAAKKCVCGSSQCRGYIGGDLQSTEVIVHGDSDDEFPEPIMLNEDGTYRLDYLSFATVDGQGNPGLEVLVKDGNELDGLLKLDNLSGVEDSENRCGPDVSQLKVLADSEGSLPSPLFVRPKDITGPPSPAIQKSDSVYEEPKGIPNAAEVSEAANEPFLTSPPDDASAKPKAHIIDDKGSVIQDRPQMKTSRSSSSVKKGKSGSSAQNLNKAKVMAIKSQTVPAKPKRTIEETSNGRYEAVQGKLSELLDEDGGISKRKDAAKGYLKLLFLTAAGDTVNGEAIQSNRDLSMILDALLKTRSRVVLLDVINKNGLRMLHNIMKQYRRDFKKIPILRKLLKVLEYLALREVLTLEHINVGPPCPGMESFRESILSFTEHDDKQVHQIARNFRDRWIPRHIRRHGHADRDDDRKETVRGLNYNSNFSASQNPNWHDPRSRPTEAIDCFHTPSMKYDSLATGGSTTSSAEGSSANGTRIRKRKSRWDEDANPSYKLSRGVVDEASTAEDAPPGFSTLPDNSKVSSNYSSPASTENQIGDKVQYLRCPFDAVIGQPQERFKPRSPVSYGVPLLILQQFGTPQAGNIDSWAIAPGMPFHPFPPLPPHPRSTKQQQPSSTYSADCGTNNRNQSPRDRECQAVASLSHQSVPQKRHLSPNNWNSSYSSDDNTVECHSCGKAESWVPSQDSKNPSPARSVGLGTDLGSRSPDETLVENHSPAAVDDGNTADQEDMMESSFTENQSSSVFKRLKGSSSSSSSSQDLGRRYLRQQKGNSAKPPPWVWRRKCWGYSGLNSRVGTVVNEQRNSSSSAADSLVCKKGDRDDGSDYQC